MLRILQQFILTTLFAVFASQASAMFIQADWFDPTQPGVGTNRYAYSGNDPISQSDRNGNFFTWEDVQNTVGRLFGESQDTRDQRNADALGRAQSELDRFQGAVNAGEYDFLSDIARQEALDARLDRVNTYSRRVRNAQGSAAVDAIIMGVTLGGVRAGGAATANAAKIANAAIPNARYATIDPRKITEYVLNPAHPVGGNKARVFESALGINQQNARVLMSQLQSGVRTQPAVVGRVDQFGTRYTVNIPVRGPNGTANVQTGWIIDTGSTVPRLVTAFVK